MRFGIGLGLWAKDEWADLGTSDGSGVPSQHSDSGATSDQGAGPAEGANGSPPGPTPAPLNVIARIGAADSDTKQAVRAYAASKGYKVTKRDLANDAAADLNAWMDRRG